MINEEIIKKHLISPKNVGEIKDAHFIIAHTNNVCGDSIKLYANVEGTTIKELKYKVFGCSTTIAVSSILSEFIKNKDIMKVMDKIEREIPLKRNDLEEVKRHSYDLVFEAIMKLCNRIKEESKCLNIE